MNGLPIGVRNDIDVENETPNGAYDDVKRACHIWLMERDIAYANYQNGQKNYYIRRSTKDLDNDTD